jgi:hypothetical protein
MLVFIFVGIGRIHADPVSWDNIDTSQWYEGNYVGIWIPPGFDISQLTNLLNEQLGIEASSERPVVFNLRHDGEVVHAMVFDGVTVTPIILEKDGETWKINPLSTNYVSIEGRVTYNSNPVCAMILANGKHMFSCSGDGRFSLNVPLDENGQITVFSFCSGLAPFRTTIYPEDGKGMLIELQNADPGQGMEIQCDIQAIGTTRAQLTGTVSYNGSPVCAMVLANGQHMFTCSGDGSFSLNVPLDNLGSVTLFGFCSGLRPYHYVFTAEEIY